ncbi:MAG: DUF4332 domain-containing protein [Filomicrobium sp.]
MTLAFQILRAAHASGTHHKLALDALQDLQGQAAQDWQRVFLKHCKLFLEGSKAPDKEFKDFKNHVLHPGDEYWGGAPEKVRNWYFHLVEALKTGNWSEAAYCAGILSHYYTDPVMPFHTGQSDAESAIHRATEWSINKSYDSLIKEATKRDAPIAPPAGTGENWLAKYACLAADTSHQHYEKLIAHYDITTGVVSPEKGLDPVARRIVGDMLVFARTGFACLLARAIKEADVAPPKVNLTAQSVIASLTIPARWVLNKIDDANIRKEVEAMFDELMTTGKVEKNLPEDDRAIRDLHAKEVLEPRRKARAKERDQRIANGHDKSSKKPLPKIGTAAPATAAKPAITKAPEKTTELERSTPTTKKSETAETLSPPPKPATEPADRQLSSYQPRQPAKGPRIYLAAEDDIEAAPSIGPKTATRLATVGLYKVSDLLAADPETVAAGLGENRITAPTVSRWQDESRLMMTIPGLRVTQSQLLVGAGYRYTEDIAEAKPEELSAAILAFAATTSGQRMLRNGDPPDIEKLKNWIDAASTAAKAA